MCVCVSVRKRRCVSVSERCRKRERERGRYREYELAPTVGNCLPKMFLQNFWNYVKDEHSYSLTHFHLKYKKNIFYSKRQSVFISKTT